jgi:hypothetical protein
MLRKTSYLVFSLVLVIASLSSCNKKCVIVKDTNDSGLIISDVVFYPPSGYMSSNMGIDFIIDADHKYSDIIEISMSGSGRAPIDFTQYKGLCFPVYATCNASFDRSVTIDDATQTVLYKIDVTQCPDCTDTLLTENYVLVPNFPSNYTLVQEVTYTNK